MHSAHLSFQLPVGVGVALSAVVFPLAVKAGVALRAVLFHLAVRTGVAFLAQAFPLPMRTRGAHRAVVFTLAVWALDCFPHHYSRDGLVSYPRARWPLVPRASKCISEATIRLPFALLLEKMFRKIG